MRKPTIAKRASTAGQRASWLGRGLVETVIEAFDIKSAAGGALSQVLQAARYPGELRARSHALAYFQLTYAE